VTNVLPSDTQFADNVIYNISSSTTVTVNVHSAVGGASVIGQDINAAAPAATNVAVAWNTVALGAAIPNVLRIEFYFGTIPAGGSGTLTYRVRVK
jgi:alcohol dehydrogenase YqhD (iron-dependent ADH family)